MIIPTYTETSTHTHPHAHDSYTHTRTYARTHNCAYTRLMLCVMHCLYFNGVGASRHVYILLIYCWRHNGHDGVSNYRHHHWLLNRLFGRRSKKTSKYRVTGLCAGNSPVTDEFPAQMTSNAENVSIWWRYHVLGEISHVGIMTYPTDI